MSLRQFLKNLARPVASRRKAVSPEVEAELARAQKSSLTAGVHLTRDGVAPSADLEQAAALGRNSRGSN